MSYSKFKNDGRANPDLVIDHMVKEAEKQIKAMTGEEVKLKVERKQ
ncbi:MAG: hypothetical protein GX663_03030 [Clostridiales bacterium]|nr:hypothetical protein [Clostridiales bacterium]